MSSEQASLSDVIIGLLAKPLQAVKITYLALIHPTRLYKDEPLGDRAALKAALTYWTFVVGIVVVTLGTVRSIFAADVMFPELPGLERWNSWRILANTYFNNAAAKQFGLAIFFLLVCLAWYLSLRMFVRKGRVSVAQFVHCCAYPAAAVQVFGILTYVAMMAVIMSAPIDVSKIPQTAARIGCLDTTQYLCRTYYVLDQHPVISWGVASVTFIPWVWSWVGISMIAKDKLGIRKRVTLGALAMLAVWYVVIVLLISLAFFATYLR